MSLSFNVSEENVMLVDALGEAMKPWANELKAELQDMVDNSVFPAEMWQTFADVGLLGCLVPEQYGGTDVGLLPLALGFEKIAAMGISPNMLLVTCMDSACLARNATDAIKEQYLPGIVSGDMRFCFAITEADAGTNSFNMKTSAERQRLHPRVGHAEPVKRVAPAEDRPGIQGDDPELHRRVGAGPAEVILTVWAARPYPHPGDEAAVRARRWCPCPGRLPPSRAG